MRVFKKWFAGSFWKDGLSIDETKISILVVILIFCVTFSLVMYYLRGDMSNNMLGLLTSLIYAITGVNIADKIGDIFINKPNITSGPGIDSDNNKVVSIEKQVDKIIPEIKPVIENNITKDKNTYNIPNNPNDI